MGLINAKIQHILQAIQFIEQQLKGSENGPDEITTYSPLALNSTQYQLNNEVADIRHQLTKLNGSSTDPDKSSMTAYKLEQIGNRLEALIRTVQLQKSGLVTHSKNKAPKKHFYQPDLSQPRLELTKLEHFKSKLEQQLNQLIDKSAPAHQIRASRERLTRCLDAISTVQQHLKD